MMATTYPLTGLPQGKYVLLTWCSLAGVDLSPLSCWLFGRVFVSIQWSASFRAVAALRCFCVGAGPPRCECGPTGLI